jgi:hypothetical protein
LPGALNESHPDRHVVVLVEGVAVIPAIYTHLAAALLGAAVAATSAWSIQGWRLGGQISAMQAQHAAERAQDQADARAAETHFNTQYQEALNEARTREIALRRARDAARAESDGLREQLSDAARRIADAPPAAVAEYATTVGELLAVCSRERAAFAAAADGHAADVRTLTAAWPVNPNPRRPDGGTTESKP